DQNWRACASTGGGPRRATVAALGQGTPIFTQRSRVSIWAAESLPLGGIFRSRWLTACRRRLSPGLVGETAGPRVPPWRRASRLVGLSPPRALTLPWHCRQWAWRMGRTRASKNLADSGPAGGPAANAGAAPARNTISTAHESRVGMAVPESREGVYPYSSCRGR